MQRKELKGPEGRESNMKEGKKEAVRGDKAAEVGRVPSEGLAD